VGVGPHVPLRKRICKPGIKWKDCAKDFLKLQSPHFHRTFGLPLLLQLELRHLWLNCFQSLLLILAEALVAVDFSTRQVSTPGQTRQGSVSGTWVSYGRLRAS